MQPMLMIIPASLDSLYLSPLIHSRHLQLIRSRIAGYMARTNQTLAQVARMANIGTEEFVANFYSGELDLITLAKMSTSIKEPLVGSSELTTGQPFNPV